MSKIDFKKVTALVVSFVDGAGTRVPVSALAAEIADSGKVAGYGDLEVDEREVLVRAAAILDPDLDIRAGRAGGVGRCEWFKGGKAALEPSGAAAKIAKRLRDDHGAEKDRAVRAANAYLDALAEGATEPLADAEILRKFGG